MAGRTQQVDETEQLISDAEIFAHAPDEVTVLSIARGERDEAGDLAVIEAQTPELSLGRGAKRLLDIVGSMTLALIFAPFIAFIVIALGRHGATVFFKHKRVGRNGELFYCWKFRTMVQDADRVLQDVLDADSELRAEWLRDHKLRDDPRVTRVGRFLRRTSLDELPQLWNVLKGEMSLVGPRPVTRQELLRYGRNMLMYTLVKPGITGLWQVSGRSNTDYRRRVALDVCYVRKRSFLFDLWILIKTTRVVVGRHGAY